MTPANPPQASPTEAERRQRRAAEIVRLAPADALTPVLRFSNVHPDEATDLKAEILTALSAHKSELGQQRHDTQDSKPCATEAVAQSLTKAERHIFEAAKKIVADTADGQASLVGRGWLTSLLPIITRLSTAPASAELQTAETRKPQQGATSDAGAKSDEELAADDRRYFGTSFMRRHSDGRMERIAPQDIFINRAGDLVVHGNQAVQVAEPFTPENSGQRGQDKTDILYEAYQVVRALKSRKQEG